MRINFPHQSLDPVRNSFAILCGLIGGILPNQKSNIPHSLLGFIFALLFTKIVFGDYDAHYQWSMIDLFFVFVVGGLGAISAIVSRWLLETM